MSKVDIRRDYTRSHPEPRTTARSGDAPEADPSNIDFKAPKSGMPEGIKMPTGREPGCMSVFSLIRRPA
jgi:hypothetical protein